MKKDRHEAQDRQGARFDAHMAKLTALAAVSQLTAAATRLRASSRTARAARPAAWTDEGFPHEGPIQRSIAVRTSGSRGVVALWSK